MENFFLLCLVIIFMAELVIYAANINTAKNYWKHAIYESRVDLPKTGQNLVSAYEFVLQSYSDFIIAGVQVAQKIPASAEAAVLGVKFSGK